MDPLRVIETCQYSLGAGEAVSPLVGSRCTHMVGFIYEVPETIVVLGFL